LDKEIQQLGLFVSFPDDNNAEPSKAQLKKLEKLKQVKAQKEAKKQGKEGGQPAAPEKGGEK